MTCAVCAYPLIPGLTACVNCGEPCDSTPSAEDIARWQDENSAARSLALSLTQARALEHAGDLATAIAIYEELLTVGCAYPTPYRRLAILYRKTQRPADEERVVREALARLSDYTNGWFIVRLAKILSRSASASGLS